MLFRSDAAAYVARYVLKKVGGVMADDHYMQIDLDRCATWVEPEFVLMSRNPGIGKTWFEKYYKDVFPADKVPVPGKGNVPRVPRYYESIFEEVFERELEEVKRFRQEFRRDHADDYTPERLMDAYYCYKARMEMKKRRE